MQSLKYGIFLFLGLALQACGDDSEGDGGGADSGGSTSTGGSSTGGSSGAGTTGGSTSTGGSSGAGTTGGSTSTGGSAGSGGSTAGSAGSGGGCMSGQVNLFDSPECEEFFDCVFDAACAQSGQPQALCVELIKQTLSTQFPACTPSADVMAACDMAKANPNVTSMYPQCVD